MDSNYILPKLLYVCLYTLYGSALGYISIFYSESLNLSSNQIGFLLALAPFIQVVSCPFWTLLADKKPSWHGPLLGILATIGGSSVLTLYFIPKWIQESDFVADNVMALTIALGLIFAFFGSPICALVDSAVLKLLGDQKILYGNQRLWGSVSNGANLFLVGLLVSSKGIEVSFLVFLVGIISFVLLSMFIKFDSHMIDQMSITDTHDSTINNAAREGNERDSLLSRRLPRNNSYNDVIAQPLHHGNYLYNPLEHSAMKLQDSRHSSFISRWNSVANTEYLGDENANLYQTTSVAALDVQMEANELLTNILSNDNRPVTFPPLGLALSNVPTIDTSLSAFAAVGNPGSDAPEKSTLKNCVVQTFLVSVLLFGIAYSMICQFLFLLFRDLGMDASLMGLIGPIGGIAEVVTFWLFKQMSDRFSVTILIIASHLSFIFRALVYTCLTPNDTKSIIIALALQLINGFSYALMWCTSVAEVDSFFPPEQRAIAQGILAATFSGLGYGLGSVLGGYIYSMYGFNALFQASAAFTGASLLVFLSGRKGATVNRY